MEARDVASLDSRIIRISGISRPRPRDAWLAVFVAIAFIRDNPLLSGIRVYAIMMVAVSADAECRQQRWMEQRQ